MILARAYCAACDKALDGAIVLQARPWSTCETNGALGVSGREDSSLLEHSVQYSSSGSSDTGNFMFI